MRSLVVAAALVLSSAGCLVGEEGAFLDHDEASDFEEPSGGGKADLAGVPAVFDKHAVMTDELFTDVAAVTADELQIFFEESPYGNRSWLADATVGDLRAADAIVAAAQAEGLNPIIMVARMQVEKSLVSKTVRPGGNSVDFAFGCGCPDGRACNEAYRGLDKQVACAARTLRKWYDGSVAGDGLWVQGRGKRTLDPTTVTPRNHATASLYAYTPWVLTGRGGNWLVWNVTRKYVRHLDAQLNP